MTEKKTTTTTTAITTEVAALYSMETFLLWDAVDTALARHVPTSGYDVRAKLIELMRLAHRDGAQQGTITMTVEGEEEEEAPAAADVIVDDGDHYLSPDQARLDEMGYETVIGMRWRMSMLPEDDDSLLSEAEKSLGFRLVRETARHGYEVIKVLAPAVLRERGIYLVNAYPAEVVRAYLVPLVG